ncbi:hypothetical protein M9Q43_08415 [Flavobacterium sp. HXWNR29]|uniref:hypothetical protein n=1 Tax=Flavobacterium odoriferum TaxID=2946604 RepID=UPI0021CB2CF2|nr:hypothetical protein [Flavobacterium sp. HXWNR29]MCU4189184.1 hypothetical protein [Flavobacterium sp. HXWNR29]
MRTILLSFFLIYFTNVFCQDKEISFEGYSHMRKKGFKIRVIEKEDILIIETRKLDTISKKMLEDKQYKKNSQKIKNLQNQEKFDKREVQSLVIEDLEIRNKYSTQEIDSLIIDKSQFINYYNLFTQIFKTPINILENKSNSRIVLDGHSIPTIIKNKSRVVFLQLQSPNENSHPILFNFLKETLNLYRKEKPTNTLNTEYTFGN